MWCGVVARCTTPPQSPGYASFLSARFTDSSQVVCLSINPYQTPHDALVVLLHKGGARGSVRVTTKITGHQLMDMLC